jgi:hypothetical protein
MYLKVFDQKSLHHGDNVIIALNDFSVSQSLVYGYFVYLFLVYVDGVQPT